MLVLGWKECWFIKNRERMKGVHLKLSHFHLTLLKKIQTVFVVCSSFYILLKKNFLVKFFKKLPWGIKFESIISLHISVAVVNDDSYKIFIPPSPLHSLHSFPWYVFSSSCAGKFRQFYGINYITQAEGWFLFSFSRGFNLEEPIYDIYCCLTLSYLTFVTHHLMCLFLFSFNELSEDSSWWHFNCYYSVKMSN